MSFSKIILVGHVGADAEVRTTTGGLHVANFSIATNDRKMVDGTLQEYVQWWRVDAMQKGDTGMVTGVIAKYVKRGGQVMIEGQPIQDEWIDKTTGAKRTALKIRIGHPGTHLELCGRPGNGRGQPPNGEATEDAGEPMSQRPSKPLTDDDIPF